MTATAPHPLTLNAADDSRTLMVVQWYREGRTLEEIGSVFGVTRERIRQIKERYEEQTGQAVDRPSLRTLVSPTDVLRICRRADVHSPFVVAKEAGISSEEVRRLLKQLEVGPAVFRLWRMRKKTEKRRVYIEKMQVLAATLGRTPSSTDLNRTPGMPYPSQYTQVFGSLPAAQVAAGLVPYRGKGGRISQRNWKKNRPATAAAVATPETPRDHVANAAQILLLAVRLGKSGQSVTGMVEDARARLRAALDLLDAQEGK